MKQPALLAEFVFFDIFFFPLSYIKLTRTVILPYLVRGNSLITSLNSKAKKLLAYSITLDFKHRGRVFE